MAKITLRTLRPTDPRPLGEQGYNLSDAMKLLKVNDPCFVLYCHPLAACKFAVWGRGADGLHHPVPHLLFWRYNGVMTETIDVDRSEIVDHKANLYWTDVRLIPALEAPNIHQFIDDKLFHDAFEMVVVGDPEVMALYNDSAAVSRLEAVSRRHFFADLRTVRLGTAPHGTRLGLHCFDRLKSVAANEDERRAFFRFAHLVGNKTSRLMGLLERGRLSADGFWRDDLRCRLPIDATVWKRHDLEVDFETSDIRYVETKNIEWRSVMIRAPNIDGFADAPDADLETEEPLSSTIEKPSKQVVLAGWLRKKYPVRPAMTTDELMKQARAELSGVGAFSTRTLESAIQAAYKKP